VPLLTLFMPPVEAVPLAICLQFLGGLIGLRESLQHCHPPSLLWLSLGAVAGSPTGLWVLGTISADTARLGIAAITAVAVALVATGFAFRTIPGRPAMLGVGLLAGLFNGLAAMPGPPVVAFYMAVPLPRLRVRASLIVFFLGTAAMGVASGLALGLVDAQAMLSSAAAFPLMYAGTRVGHYLFRFGSDLTHRRIALALLAGAAFGAALKAASGLLAQPLPGSP
jgi:uncharacterized membrane protein YfcA